MAAANQDHLAAGTRQGDVEAIQRQVKSAALLRLGRVPRRQREHDDLAFLSLDPLDGLHGQSTRAYQGFFIDGRLHQTHLGTERGDDRDLFGRHAVPTDEVFY